MTNAQRDHFLIDYRKAGLDGNECNKRCAWCSGGGTPSLKITAPATVAGSYLVGTASFRSRAQQPGSDG